jgi:sugar porter (SP) family MFS transporter
MVGAFQFNIVLGILVAYLSNYLIDTMHLGADEWRWKFSVAAVPALILFALLFTIPQSPRWLALKGRRDEARAVLRRIAPEEAQAEEDAILADTVPQPQAKLSWSKYRKPMLLASGVAFFNQMTGINAILYYMNDIFAAAGFSSVSAGQQTIIVGAVNLLFTMLALGVIDKAGRKTLLLIGAVGIALSLAGTAAIMFTGLHRDLLLWMLIGFIAAFAFSQGAVIWVYISEVFPTEVRSRGQSLGSSTHWCMDAIIAYLFPVIAAYSKGAPFVFFAGMMVVQFFVVWAWFPETKRVTLEEMAARIG